MACQIEEVNTLSELSNVEKKLKELDYELPPPPDPMAKYDSYLIDGDNIYLAGQGPLVNGKCPEHLKGKLGERLTVEQGQEAAAISALNVLSVLKKAAGSLDNVKLLRVLGFVACADDFGQQPTVIDGASKLFKQVMGENGKHSRVALGTNALPFETPVEIEVFAKIIR